MTFTTELRLDYPVGREPRYPIPAKPHPRLAGLLARGHVGYADFLHCCLVHLDALAAIPLDGDPDGVEAYWRNGFIPGMDAVTLYGMVADRRPAHIIEIGSGHSTRFLAKAIREHSPHTRLLSIDPAPRAQCDRLCDEIIRAPLETVDLERFDALQAGDIVFMDGSHRCFMHSDTTVFFLDVLPALAPGVMVGIHDICLPFDYPEAYVDWYWSEQYLLAAYLLAECPWFSVYCPSVFAAVDPVLCKILQPIWDCFPPAAIETHGSIFWLQTCLAERKPVQSSPR